MSADDEAAVFVGRATAVARKRRALLLLRRLWFVHNSGRFDRPAPAWRAALTWLRRRGVLVTGTEAAGRTRLDFGRALGGDWDYVHLAGAALGECYATWDPTVFEQLGKAFARQLTEMTWRRSPEYGGKQAAPVHALVVKLGRVGGRRRRRFWVVVVHMPLDNTELRADIWEDCCSGLVALARDLKQRDPGAELVLVADWNKNLRLLPEHRAVVRHLLTPLDLRISWMGFWPTSRRTGTHGSQLIDYALAARFAGCQLLKDLPDSDHRAFRYRTKEPR